jgi:hypothetical protein
MNYFRNLIDTWQLKRSYESGYFIDKPEVLDRIVHMRNGLMPKSKYQKKRDILAKIAKQIRKAHPYQPEDYSEEKLCYDNYHSRPDSIESFESLVERVKQGPVYLKKISHDYPVKGDRYGSYYINTCGGGDDIGIVIKATSVEYYNDKPIYLSTSDCRQSNDLHSSSVSDNFFSGYVYASEEDIQIFQQSQLAVQELKKKIAKKNREISSLNQEIYNIYQNCKTSNA